MPLTSYFFSMSINLAYTLICTVIQDCMRLNGNSSLF